MNAITPIAEARLLEPRQALHWEGRPTWWACAVHIWKVRVAAVYFAVLLADGMRLAMAGTRAPPGAWTGEVKLLIVATVAMGGLMLLAALTARTTRYTLDDEQLTLNYGIALPAKLTIPYAAIEHVGIRVHADRTGDVALRLNPGRGVMYAKLWPHARPWKFSRPEPMLRCVPDAGVAGAMICRAIAAVKPAQLSEAAVTPVCTISAHPDEGRDPDPLALAAIQHCA